jgi:hypothetical protein
VRGQSIRPYLAAIGAQHRRIAIPDPTVRNLFQLKRRGFAAADTRGRSGAPMRSAAYLAAAAVSESRVLRYWAVVSVCF